MHFSNYVRDTVLRSIPLALERISSSIYNLYICEDMCFFVVQDLPPQPHTNLSEAEESTNESRQCDDTIDNYHRLQESCSLRVYSTR